MITQKCCFEGTYKTKSGYSYKTSSGEDESKLKEITNTLNTIRTNRDSSGGSIVIEEKTKNLQKLKVSSILQPDNLTIVKYDKKKESIEVTDNDGTHKIGKRDRKKGVVECYFKSALEELNKFFE